MPIEPCINDNVPFIFFSRAQTKLIDFNITLMMTERQSQGVVDTEQEDLPVRSEPSQDVIFEVLFSNMERMSSKIAMLHEATNAESIDFDLDDENQAGTNSVFDPTESLTNGSNSKSLEKAELPYDDLFEDSKDCGPKDLDGVAKRVNSSCALII